MDRIHPPKQRNVEVNNSNRSIEEKFTENLSNFSSTGKEGGGGCFLRYFIERIQYFINRPGSRKQYQNTFLPSILSNRFVFPRASQTRLFRPSDSPRRNDRCIHLSLSLSLSSRLFVAINPALLRVHTNGQSTTGRRNRMARCSIRRANGKNRERERERGG